MKDVLGNELKEGDRVAFPLDGYPYAIGLGVVIGFTPKKIKVVVTGKRFKITYDETCTKFPEQVVRLPA